MTNLRNTAWFPFLSVVLLLSVLALEILVGTVVARTSSSWQIVAVLIIGAGAFVVLSAFPHRTASMLWAGWLIVMLVSIRMYLASAPTSHFGGTYALYIDASDLVLAGLLAWGIARSVSANHVQIRLGRLDFLWLALMGWGALSIRWSGAAPLVDFGVWELIHMGRSFLVFLAVRLVVDSELTLRDIRDIISISIIFEGTVAIAQYVTGNTFAPLGPSELATLTTSDYRWRASGTFIHSNALGTFFAMTVPIALTSWLDKSQGSLHRILHGTAILVGLVGIVTSLSRGAWGGLALAIFAVVLLTRRQSLIGARESRAILLVGGVVIAVAWLLAGGSIVARLFDTPETNQTSRIVLIQTAVEMLRNNPIKGVGLNTFLESMALYYRTGLAQYLQLPVHNAFMLYFAESGLVGGLLFVGIMVSLLTLAWRLWRTVSGPGRLLALGIGAGFLGQVLHMQVDWTYRIDEIMLVFWFLAGLLVAIQQISEAAAGISQPREQGIP